MFCVIGIAALFCRLKFGKTMYFKSKTQLLVLQERTPEHFCHVCRHRRTRSSRDGGDNRVPADAEFDATGVYPAAASGAPFSAACIAVTGDTLADINEDLAAEQKARVTYDNILRFADDPDVRDPIKFLREREIVHYQRFGEGLRIATDRLDSKNFYAFNPSFD